MKLTSAAANKEIRALEEEKAHLLATENEVSTYILAVDEIEEPPAYDYAAVRLAVADLDRKVMKLRHALHVFNVETVLPESGLTIDEALIVMAQLNGEKYRLSLLRSMQPKQRVNDRYMSGSRQVEYKYANYDIQQAEADFQKVSDKIRALQMEIDFANQTEYFVVDL